MSPSAAHNSVPGECSTFNFLVTRCTPPPHVLPYLSCNADGPCNILPKSEDDYSSASSSSHTFNASCWYAVTERGYPKHKEKVRTQACSALARGDSHLQGRLLEEILSSIRQKARVQMFLTPHLFALFALHVAPF